MYVCMYVRTNERTYICMYVRTCVHVRAYVRLCMNVCMYVCMSVQYTCERLLVFLSDV